MVILVISESGFEVASEVNEGADGGLKTRIQIQRQNREEIEFGSNSDSNQNQNCEVEDERYEACLRRKGRRGDCLRRFEERRGPASLRGWSGGRRRGIQIHRRGKVAGGWMLG